jgi:choline-sulfatase
MIMKKWNKQLLWVCIGVILCAVFLVLFFGVFKASPDFKRVQLAPRDFYSQGILQRYKLEHFKSGGANYFYSRSEGASFNGDLLILRGQAGKKRLDFHPNLKGRFNLNIEFLVLLKEKTTKTYLEVFQNKEKILAQNFPGNEIYSLDRDVQLAARDRFTIIAGGKGVILLGSPIFYKIKPVKERSYVFLICADTLRADHLPTYGYRRETGPNIHLFSKDAVVFENAYSQSPWTLPSHMSLFTSLYEFNHGVKKAGTLSPEVDFLVEELSGKWAARSINGGGWVSADFGFNRGFDLYKSYSRCGPQPDSAKTLFQKAMEDLKKHNFPRSFYFLHSYQIHTPYQPRREFVAYFNPNPKYKQMVTPIHLNNKKLSPEEAQEIKLPMIDLYDGEIRSFDHWFGKFIGYLKKEKIYDDAMIIFISDHGEEFHEHRKWGHGHSLYNEVTRVPLIIKLPKNRFKGTTVKDKVGLIDVMPTILSFYHIDRNGANKPGRIDGIDLIPVIKGKSLNRPIISSITSGFYSPGDAFKAAIIEDHFKIICAVPYKKTMSLNASSALSAKRFEFYDLLTDPAETRNLHLKEMYTVKKFQDLFDGIITKGVQNLNQKGKNVIMDKKMQDALKALGYL